MYDRGCVVSGSSRFLFLLNDCEVLSLHSRAARSGLSIVCLCVSFLFLLLLSPHPLMAQCSPVADTDLQATKNAGEVVLTFTTNFWDVQSHSVFRETSAPDITLTQPWRTIDMPDHATSELIPDDPIVFYRVLPNFGNFFTVDWIGVGPDLTDDGFKPAPLLPYADGIEDLGLSADPAEFWVEVNSLMNCIPDHVELFLDRNDDGDYEDAGEVIPLTEDDPSDVTTFNGKRYRVFLPDGSISQPAYEAPGTPPGPTSPLYARDEFGNIRWAKVDGTGTMLYRFRAGDSTAEAGGPATADTPFTLLNTASELIQNLGIPLVQQGDCSYDTDWQTALAYFEEAEALLKPPSPYNLAPVPARHPDYLSAMMASVISETAYTMRNYDTLFQSDPGKLYRDVMSDWIDFANEQSARLDAIALNAPSAPDPAAWKLNFPKFCIYTEDGAAPLAAARSIVLSRYSSALSDLDTAITTSLFPISKKLSTPAASGPLRDSEPVYIFGDNVDSMAEWDRSDAYLLKTLALSIHAAAAGYRIYEDPSGTAVTVADLDWIETALQPEDDARDHAECDPEPCPPLNGVDDDGDGLVDDLGFAARVVEMFPGLGIYTPDGALTLETVANDSSSIIHSLREGMRLVLKESDNQTGTGNVNDYADATLIYAHNYGRPPTFEDTWSYTDGSGVSDGLPDLQYGVDDILPIAWCPEDGIQHAPPMDIQGGLGEDIEWWTDQIIDFYNEYSGELPLDPDCYPQAWAYTVLVCDWGWQWQRSVLPAGDPDHTCFNFRDDVEDLLAEYDVDPADLGPDFQAVLEYLECIDVRQFVDDPEDIRDYLPYTCTDAGILPAGETADACDSAGTYAFNGFFGDWDEPMDPIVPDKFWTIEPFSVLTQDDHGLNNEPSCDMGDIGFDTDCIVASWDDKNGNGQFDLFEPLLMADSETPLHWIDLNNDGQWNGWTDESHLKVDPAYYQGLGLPEPADPGTGLYNGLYIYFKDPTFGGRFPDMTNEDLNNFIGTAAGWSAGPLEFPFDNHRPSMGGPAIVACTAPGANYCFQANATDADGDPIRYKLVVPSLWTDSAWPYQGHEVLVDGRVTGRYELQVPIGDTWGLILLAYDNVNNLNDITGVYLEVTR